MIMGERIDLKSNPVDTAKIDKIRPIYSKPYLPIPVQYLTGVKIVLKDRSVIVLDDTEWIHPEGISMGMVNIATEQFMVSKQRISRVDIITKKNTGVAGVAISLADGGMFLLVEGWYKARKVSERRKKDKR